MSDTFKVGIVQTKVIDDNSKFDFTENLNRFESLVASAAKSGAQVICLQEMFNSPYFCTVEDHKFYECAESLDGVTVSRFSKLAKSLNIVLVLPIFEKRGAGVYHNSAVVLDADGSTAGVYRKMHIPDDPLYYEKFYFTPGDSEPGYQVFNTKYAKVGVLICWDQWYPEGARITAMKGAEVLFYPTAIGWHPAEKEEFGSAQREAWRTIQRSHAIANGVYVASPNRIGHELTPGTDGIEFFGSSMIVDPFGRLVCDAGQGEEILVHECSRKLIETTRQHWPFFRDRRIDSYGPILKRWGE